MTNDQENKTARARSISRAMAMSAAVLSTCLMLFLLVSAAPYFDKTSDMPEYVVAGRMLLTGQGSKVYETASVVAMRKALFPTMRERTLAVFSPPPALPLLIPFAVLPIDIVRLLWQPFLLLASASSILMLNRIYRLTVNQTLWLWTICALFAPLFESIRIGQISALLLLTLCGSLALFKRRADIGAGALLAIFILKPQELITFGVFLLGARRYRAVLSGCGVVLLLTAISFLLLGSAGYHQYFDVLSNMQSAAEAMHPELTPTIRGQLVRLGVAPGLTSALSALCLLAAIAGSFIWGRMVGKNWDWLESGLIITVPIGLLTAFLVHYYDLVLLVPVAVVLIKSPLAKRFPDAVKISGMAALMVFILPISNVVHYEWLVTGVSRINPFTIILLIASIVIVVYSLKYKTLSVVPD